MQIADIDKLPLQYNKEMINRPPEAVKHFKQIVSAARGVVISTPQFNYDIPVALRHVLEWVGNPPEKNELTGKTAVIIGATIDDAGADEARRHLREILIRFGMEVLDKDVAVINIKSKILPSGEIVDPELKAEILALIKAITN